jgi:hypothetical protein
MRRVTISGLMIFILACGVGAAALANPTSVWDSIVFTATLLILTASIPLAVYRNRPFWLGFAVFGWSYLLAGLIPRVEARLLTTEALTRLDSLAASGRAEVQLMVSSGGDHLVHGGQVRLWDARTGMLLPPGGAASAHFVQIGHGLFALLAGLAGGIMVSRLERRSR